MFFAIQIVLVLIGIFLLLRKRVQLGDQEIGSPLAGIIGAVLVAPFPISMWVSLGTQITTPYSVMRDAQGYPTSLKSEAKQDASVWVDPIVTFGAIILAGTLAVIALKSNDPLAGVDSKFTEVSLNTIAPSPPPPVKRARPTEPAAPSATELARQLFAPRQYEEPSTAFAPSSRTEQRLPDPEPAPRFPEPEPKAPSAKYPSLPANLPALARRLQTQSRTYYHTACGGSTTVSGDDFKALDNPFREVSETYCCGCCQMVSLASVTWEDTGETILSSRKKQADATPFWEQMKRTIFG